ncbi:MAG: bifunctional 2-polyprenyl-6-hydroxyphenol methylase/3-demethylubiquinol 3-O-methyltransferase UbiG [Pseudomonadota bacterium]|nr:bifunctional 2-polyprenyl-6-hydroxyphenol methylase/3-demethylubiquinol 3-O-methyltransferase UbiG [Pseudomonadota bacterium]
MNIDEQEVEKFDSVAHHWWDPDGPFKPLHMLNPVRLNFIKKKLELKNKKIIDVGCGGGLLSEELCKNGAKVTGLDSSTKSIEIANAHKEISKLHIEYHNMSIEEFIKQEEKNYDALCCLELIEHVSDPENLLKNCSNLVKENGDIFISTINRNILSFVFAILGAEYILNLLPKGTHQYKNFLKPSELNSILKKNSLEIFDIKGIKYNPFSKSFSESKNVDINYILHCKKI